MYSVDPIHKQEWQYLSQEEIVLQLFERSQRCRNVTISGGNPALHDLTYLIQRLVQLDYNINVETQGTMYRSWFGGIDTLTVSPKPPSAGTYAPFKLHEFMLNYDHDDNSPPLMLKVVVDYYNLEDYEFAKYIFGRWGHFATEKYISLRTCADDTSEALLERYNKLADLVIQDHDSRMQDVHVGIQQHVLLWGHQRGV